ncbi:hypothetical protein PEC106568_21670 [Pectobacterium carotovorum subsp. carotovorum]|nr:hypothetical protein PEC106568_21670 [Pectobacterium carotovorum subsp. carotovorum]
MEIIISMIISCVFYWLLIKIYKLSNVQLTGDKTHPIALFFIIQFCIFSLPGVIIISFFGHDSPRYWGINTDLKFEIGLWYIYSIVIFIIITLFFLKLFNVRFYDKFVSRELNFNSIEKKINIILFISILSLGLNLFFSKTPPLFYLIKGDVEMAYSARFDMQTNPQDYYLPYISNFVSLLLTYQFYFICYCYVFSNKKSSFFKICLLISFIISAINCLYETQKAPLIYLLLGGVFIFYLKRQKINKLIISFFTIAIIATLLQSFVVDVGFFDAIDSSADRFLLGQNQGFYHIINSVTPDEKYWFSGFYFIERLGITTSRADVDIVSYLDFYKGTDVVNVNSYYLGEAWSMFGYYGLIFSPFIVAISFSLFIKIIDFLIGVNSVFFLPYAIYLIPEFRINQSFNYFLYGKEFVFKLIMVFFIISIVTFFAKIRLKW